MQEACADDLVILLKHVSVRFSLRVDEKTGTMFATDVTAPDGSALLPPPAATRFNLVHGSRAPAAAADAAAGGAGDAGGKRSSSTTKKRSKAVACTSAPWSETTCTGAGSSSSSSMYSGSKDASNTAAVCHDQSKDLRLSRRVLSFDEWSAVITKILAYNGPAFAVDCRKTALARCPAALAAFCQIVAGLPQTAARGGHVSSTAASIKEWGRAWSSPSEQNWLDAVFADDRNDAESMGTQPIATPKIARVFMYMCELGLESPKAVQAEAEERDSVASSSSSRSPPLALPPSYCGLAPLSEALKTTTTLKELILCDNCISPDGVQLLANGIR